MIPQPNQYIIIVLKSGIRLDGNVQLWSDDQIILKSTTHSITTIIPDPKSKIEYYQIIQSQEKYQEVKEKPIKTNEDIRTLADLKVELNNIEREEIHKKLTTFEIGAAPAKTTNYGSPTSILKSIKPTQYPNEETGKQNPGINKGLQGLFRKK